jgi:hypothetical protein
MNYQKLKDVSHVPPGRFSFTVPENGFKIDGYLSIEDLFKKVEDHYRDNDIPLPNDWKDRVENQICMKLPAGWCNYAGDQNLGFQPNLSAETILKGVKSLAAMAMAGIKGEEVWVDQNEANKRAEICTRCFYNMPANFCSGCGAGQAIREMVSKVKGSRTTPSDTNLNSCGVCGCKNEAIVHVNRNLLLTGEKSETTAKRPDWCWVKNPDITNAESLLKI